MKKKLRIFNPRPCCNIYGTRAHIRGVTFSLRVKVFSGAWIFVTQVGCRSFNQHELMKTHMHTLPEIFYVGQGSLILLADGRKFTIDRGSMIILPAGVFHSFESEKPAELYYINYVARLDKGADRSRLNQAARCMLFPRVMIGQNSCNLRPLFEKTLERTRQTTRSVMKRNFSALVQAIMRGFKNTLEISDIKAGNAAVYNPRVAESIRYMRRNVLQDLNLSDMCRDHLGMSMRHFSRIFKRSTGYSPRDFSLQLKMKSAAAMLKKKVPAKVVAEKLGYDEIYSFYRAFHNATGHGVLVRQR